MIVAIFVTKIKAELHISVQLRKITLAMSTSDVTNGIINQTKYFKTDIVFTIFSCYRLLLLKVVYLFV
jgi:hypothetical protein